MRSKLALFIALLLFASSADAADWYVRKGAEGTNAGTSWTNAWNEMNQIVWSSISAGETVYIAGGSYTTALEPAKSGTSGSRIYVKRVRSTDTSVTDDGDWDASYDAQVVLTNVGIYWDSGNDQEGSYVTIDGQVASGIKLVRTTNDAGSIVSIDTGVTGLVLQYLEIAGPWDNINEPGGDGNGIYAITGGGRGIAVADLTVRYCTIYGSVNLFKITLNGGLIEYNTIYSNWPTNFGLVQHPNVINSTASPGTVIFRYNDVSNWVNEGIMLIGAGQQQTWKIYGNVFHDQITGGSARAVESQDREQTVYFYNNTVANATLGVNAANGGTYSASSKNMNNIFWNTASEDMGGTNDDYNFTNEETITGAHSIASGSSPFVSASNYHIVSTIGATYPRNKGVALDAEYGIDKDGIARTWSIGAYEYYEQGSIHGVTSMGVSKK